MKAAKGDVFDVEWRYFALEQVNSKQAPDWKVWEQPAASRGMPAFRAAEAARLQGREAYDRMHWALLEGRNEHNLDFADSSQIEAVARSVGLDISRFKRDLPSPAFAKKVGDDHTFAVREFGVFGTPTFMFQGTKPFFMRMTAPKEQTEAVRIFDALTTLFVERPNIDEIKRPRKPRV